MTPGRVPSTMDSTFMNDYPLGAYSSPSNNGGVSLIDHVKQELKNILPSIKVNHESYSPQKLKNIVVTDGRFKKKLLQRRNQESQVIKESPVNPMNN